MRACLSFVAVFVLAPFTVAGAEPPLVLPDAGDDTPRTVEITATDDMKFSVNAISAKPGERIRLVLVAVGHMPKLVMAHNWVLLQAGTDAEAFVNASVLAQKTDYIAPDQAHRVLAATSLIAAGESAEVTFTAPRARGEYPYVCSFRGHYQAGMWGTLTVR